MAKKQIINKETGEVMVTLEFPDNLSPQQLARKFKAYQFDCEVEVIDARASLVIKPKRSLWALLKELYHAVKLRWRSFLRKRL